mmetsp:Transcript_87205/g.167029  ORF Transcript_87205/g.167029 Transcript_87205/m.167029 type:complete len:319 (+) Transcript_87205:157-1113(+)
MKQSRENDDYWSWHNEAVSKAKKLDVCYNTPIQRQSRPIEPKIKMGVASAMQRAEQSKTLNSGSTGRPRASQAPAAKSRDLAPATKSRDLAPATKEVSSKAKPPPSSEPPEPEENHERLLCCLKSAACLGIVAFIGAAVWHVFQYSNPKVGKEHYLLCMGRLESPSHGKCTHECLKEVVEDGFTEWKMQCVPKEDRSTMRKQQTLACDCQDLVPKYLDEAHFCCTGNVSLVSGAVKTFCKGPMAYKSYLEGVFKRYCGLNDLPDYAEKQDAGSGFSVIGIALLGSLLAGMAIAGFVKLLHSSSVSSREDSTPYLNLNA